MNPQMVSESIDWKCYRYFKVPRKFIQTVIPDVYLSKKKKIEISLKNNTISNDKSIDVFLT